MSDNYTQYLKLFMKLNKNYINYNEVKRASFQSLSELTLKIAHENRIKLNQTQVERVFKTCAEFMNDNNFEGNAPFYYNIFRESFTKFLREMSVDNLAYQKKFDNKFRNLDKKLAEVQTYDINKALHFIKAQKDLEIREFFEIEYTHLIYNSGMENARNLGRKFQEFIRNDSIRLTKKKINKGKQ